MKPQAETSAAKRTFKISMKTTRIITDIVLFVTFCILAGGGIMLKFSFQKGMGPQEVWGMTKPEWVCVHLWVGFIMIAAFLVHVFLNARFFKNAFKGWKACAVFFACGLAIALALALSPTKRAANDKARPAIERTPAK